MDDYLALDILLGLIVVLFAAIGCWRGAAKEVVVTAGIFAGYALASSWAKPWGGDLADLTGLRVGTAQLLVSAIALLSATLVLGYGGSSLAGSPDVRLSGRIAGATLAAINGGLLLYYCLSFIERFLTDGGSQRALGRSHVSRFLLGQFGWLLIGAAAVGALVVLAGLLLRRRSASEALLPESEIAEPAFYHEPASRQRPARLPRGADAGKYEPIARGYDPTTGRYGADAPSVGQTIPLPPVDAEGLAYGGGRAAPAANGWKPEPPAESYAGEEWYRRDGLAPAGATPLGDPRPSPNGQAASDRWTPPGPVDGAEDAGKRPPRPATNGLGAGEDVSALSWIRRSAHPGRMGDVAAPPSSGAQEQRTRLCRACAAELGEGDSFCPRCGTPA